MKKWLLIMLLCAFSAHAVSISDFPDFFVHNNQFDPLYVIGQEAPALDVVTGTVISTSMAKYDNVTVAVGTSRTDKDVANIRDHNAIVIGSPCENKAAAELEGNPTNCFEGLSGNKGYIKLFENNGKVQLLITGVTPEDRKKAAEFLATAELSSISSSAYTITTNTNSATPAPQSYGVQAAQTTSSGSSPPEELEDEEQEIEEVEPEVVEETPEPKKSKPYKPLSLPQAEEKEQGFFAWLFSPITNFFTWLFG